jgi:phospholipid N-methyltransferase
MECAKNIRQIGTIAPDSAACVKGLLKAVPFRTADIILEFGSASGAVSHEILRRKKSNSKLFCFEKNPLFCRHLGKTINRKDAFIVNEDVFHATRVLSSRFSLKERSVDCIISTLPCSLIEIEKLMRVSVLPLLKEKGVFIQYMYTASILKGFRLMPTLRKYFNRIESDLVLLNIPPVVIYSCSGIKEKRTHFQAVSPLFKTVHSKSAAR